MSSPLEPASKAIVYARDLIVVMLIFVIAGRLERHLLRWN